MPPGLAQQPDFVEKVLSGNFPGIKRARSKRCAQCSLQMPRLERFYPDLEKSVRSKPWAVIPAKAGIQQHQAPSLGKRYRFGYQSLDSRLRGNDEELSVRVKPL